jgi:hypothetical protein
MSGGQNKRRGDVGLFYDIVDNEQKVVEQNQCHVCSINIIGSGKSVLFGVPSDSFSKDLSLRLTFSYEWEDDLQVIGGLEPKHYLFFGADDLPNR